MKSLRWTRHVLEALAEREIERAEAERTVREPTVVHAARGSRKLHVRRYHDALLGGDMLLCVVTEETRDEIIAVTAYKTSKIDKFLKRGES